MKKLLLIISIILFPYSIICQTVGIKSNFDLAGLGLYYNHWNFNSEDNILNKSALIGSAFIGKYYSIEQDNRIGKFMLGFSYQIKHFQQESKMYDDLLFRTTLKMYAGFAYNRTKPFNENINEFSLELGGIYQVNHLSMLVYGDVINLDAGLGIGYNF